MDSSAITTLEELEIEIFVVEGERENLAVLKGVSGKRLVLNLGG